MKKYFNLLSCFRVNNFNRFITKFIILFLIIPSLTFPQIAWAASAEVDRGVTHYTRVVGMSGESGMMFNGGLAVADVTIAHESKATQGVSTSTRTHAPAVNSGRSVEVPDREDDEVDQPTCLQRWGLRISRWWHGAPQTPFTEAPTPAVEMAAVGGTGVVPATLSTNKRKGPSHRVWHPEEEDSKGIDPASPLGRLSVRPSDVIRDRLPKEDARTSFSPQVKNGATIVNPLLLARHAKDKEDAARGVDPRTPAGTTRAAETLASGDIEHVCTELGDTSTSTGGSDSPPDIRAVRNAMREAIIDSGASVRLTGLPKDEEKGSAASDVEEGAVTPPTAAALASPSGSSKIPIPDEIEPRKAALIKAFNGFMLKVFNHETTRRDIIHYVATALLTGLFAIELWGEYRMVKDRTFTAIEATSLEDYRWLQFTEGGLQFTDRITNFIIINTSLALSPYLPMRLSKVLTLFTPEQEKRVVAKKIPKIAKGIGHGISVLFAAANGALPAYVSYQSNYLFTSTEAYARIVPPFIFAFYFIDSLVRMEALRTRIFNKLFVQRGSSVAREREAIVNKLKESKRVVFSMSDEELLDFYSRMVELNQKSHNASTFKEGLEQFKFLYDLKLHKSPTDSIASSTAQPKKKTATYLARQYVPPILAALFAVAGTYIAGRLSYDNFGETFRFLSTGEPTTSLYDRLVLYAARIYTDGIVDQHLQTQKLWAALPSNITIFDGNYTDWCWQCIGDGAYTMYNGPDVPQNNIPTTFHHCPGIDPTSIFTVNPGGGDLDYADWNCEGWYQFWDDYVNNFDITGTTYYMRYINAIAPYLSPALNSTVGYSLPDGGKALAGIGSGFSGLGTYGLGFVASLGFLKRIIDSFRNHPDEVMPGKKIITSSDCTSCTPKRRNCCARTANNLLIGSEMFWGGFQSFFRASPVMINGWLLMQTDQMDRGLMWTTLSVATLTSAATFFPDFDEAYSRLPGLGQRAWNWIKNGGGYLLGRKVKESKQILSKRDELILGTDRVIAMVQSADDDIIKILSKV